MTPPPPPGPFRLLFSQLLAPAAVGGATGACVAGMVGGVERYGLHALASLPSIWPAVFAPLGLFLTFLIAKYITRSKAATSELYITLYHQPDGRVPVEQVPGRVLATTATVGLGGAQGFESTSALVGATWSDLLGRVPGLGMSPKTRKSLMAAGASAGIAAVFSSPAAGALYGIEVPFRRDVDSPKLVPCVVAAVASFAVRCWLIGEKRIVEVAGMPNIDHWFLLGCLLVAVLCGFGARLFAAIESRLRVLGKRQSHGYRALIGGGILTLFAIAGHENTGRWITFGSGYTATGWVQEGTHAVGLLLVGLFIRAGANLLTVYGGGGGGVFTSLAANGAFVGQIVAELLHCDSTHSLALFGAACFLGAGYRLPFACMLFVAEAALGPAVTGLGLAAVAVAFTLMGEESVSDAQTDSRCEEPRTK